MTDYIDREIAYFLIIAGTVQFAISLYVLKKLKSNDEFSNENFIVQFFAHVIIINFAIIAFSTFCFLMYMVYNKIMGSQ